MEGNEKTKAFLADIEAVCRKHGMSISHEDSHGGFIVEAFDEHNIKWLHSASTHPNTPHEADAWIASQWMGKRVRHARYADGTAVFGGAEGKVTETFWDEKGALHCLFDHAPDGFWCPASLLALTGVVPPQ